MILSFFIFSFQLMVFEKISGDAHNPAHVFAALELRREGGWLH